jgi:hypothetical protein
MAISVLLRPGIFCDSLVLRVEAHDHLSILCIDLRLHVSWGLGCSIVGFFLDFFLESGAAQFPGY